MLHIGDKCKYLYSVWEMLSVLHFFLPVWNINTLIRTVYLECFVEDPFSVQAGPQTCYTQYA